MMPWTRATLGLDLDQDLIFLTLDQDHNRIFQSVDLVLHLIFPSLCQHCQEMTVK